MGIPSFQFVSEIRPGMGSLLVLTLLINFIDIDYDKHLNLVHKNYQDYQNHQIDGYQCYFAKKMVDKGTSMPICEIIIRNFWAMI